MIIYDEVSIYAGEMAFSSINSDMKKNTKPCTTVKVDLTKIINQTKLRQSVRLLDNTGKRMRIIIDVIFT